jgi:hypothetical protein
MTIVLVMSLKDIINEIKTACTLERREKITLELWNLYYNYQDLTGITSAVGTSFHKAVMEGRWEMADWYLSLGKAFGLLLKPYIGRVAYSVYVDQGLKPHAKVDALSKKHGFGEITEAYVLLMRFIKSTRK